MALVLNTKLIYDGAKTEAVQKAFGLKKSTAIHRMKRARELAAEIISEYYLWQHLGYEMLLFLGFNCNMLKQLIYLRKMTKRFCNESRYEDKQLKFDVVHLKQLFVLKYLMKMCLKVGRKSLIMEQTAN